MPLAPYKSVKKAVAQGFLGDLNPTPWAFMLGNTCGWVAYSFLLNNYWIFFGNCPGFLLSVWLNLCAAKLQCQDYRVKEMRRSFVTYLEKQDADQSSRKLEISNNGETINEQNQNGADKNAVTDWASLALQVTTQSKPAPAPHEKVVISIVILWVIILSTVSLGKDLFSQTTKEFIVGIVVNINLCFFYGGPLSTIATVLKTRNTTSIHIWTMTTNTANGAFWTAYGIAVQDYFISIPNGIGVLLGLVQGALVFLFPRQVTDSKADNTKVPPEQSAIEEEI